MKEWIILWVSLLLSLTWVQAQSVRVEKITAEQGLSQGMIYDLCQTHDGFIWAGTKDGLNRFDGYRCKVFSPNPFDPFSIGSGEIRKLFEDREGRLWLNYQEGIDIYIPESGRFFHLSKPKLPIFTGNTNAASPHTFAETPDGAIWVSDMNKVWRIAPPNEALIAAEKANNPYPELSFVAFELPSVASGGRPHPNDVFFSQRHGLLVGSTQGLFQWEPGSRDWQLISFAGSSTKIVGEDPDSMLWVQTVDGDLGDTFQDYRTSDQWEICTWDGQSLTRLGDWARGLLYSKMDSKGLFWAMRNHTLYQWTPRMMRAGGQALTTFTFNEPFTKVKDFQYQSLLVDRSGIAWVGTNGYGMMKVNLHKNKFNSFLPLNSQRFIVEDPLGRFFTQNNPGLLFATARFDRSEPNKWASITVDTKIWPKVFDSKGNGWDCLHKTALVRIDAHTKTMREIPWKGWGLMRCRDGQLLSVSEEGLLFFNPETEQTTPFFFDKPRSFAHDIHYSHLAHEDVDGVLWVYAYEGGLIKAVRQGSGMQFTYFQNDPKNPQSLSNNSVLCAADDPLEPRQYLWVGTKGGGINRLDKQTGVFKYYGIKQGLPDNVVYGILPGNTAYLWMSTNRGLCRFHVREEVTKNFTTADGLQHDEFNTGSYLKTRGGLLMFGGVNGLTVFHPDSLRFNDVVPQTHLISLLVNNEDFPVTGTSTPVFSYRQNFLSFEFSALEFSNPAQNRYRYQLVQEGILGNDGEVEWVELGHKNTVQFANLSPGRYVFRVLGSNNDGVWSAVPAEIRFVIAPPWWATWWAYLLYTLGAGAVVWAIYRAQLRRRLAHQEALRLRDLDDFKNRFFTNITHEFRTPLTVILGTNEQLLSGAEQWVLEAERPAVKGKLALIRRNGEGLLRLINQLLDLTKLESNTLKINYIQHDILPYLRYIAESLHTLANAQNVMLRVESDEAKIEMDYDPERLLQIVHNLLSNAIKFTSGGGRVVMRAGIDLAGLRDLPSLWLVVADTGVGIPPDDLPHIFDRFYQAKNAEKIKASGTGIGLALVKELVGLLGGDISVRSESGKGTSFTVRLPITRRAALEGKVADRSTVAPPAMSPGLPADQKHTERPTLLLIEDNPDVVEYLTACLQPHYALDFAYNGRYGIEKATEMIPDLIVSDVMMPEKDGFEVCEAVKNDPRSSHIPIVLLTAKAGVENRIAGLRRGADAYLAKPFHLEELLLTLKNLLKLRSQMQARYLEMATRETSATTLLPASEVDPESEFLKKLRTIVEENLSDANLDVETLCRKIGMSRTNLHNKLSALTGLSTTLYVRKLRLRRARKLLITTDTTIAEIAYEVGFNDPKFFSRVYSEEYGLPPSEERKRGAS